MGLVAALRLAERGERVTLLESASQAGGLASSWQLHVPNQAQSKQNSLPISSTQQPEAGPNAVEWDKFYHVILLSDSRIRSVLEQLDLDKEMKWVQTKTGFLFGWQTLLAFHLCRFSSFPSSESLSKISFGRHHFSWLQDTGLEVDGAIVGGRLAYPLER